MSAIFSARREPRRPPGSRSGRWRRRSRPCSRRRRWQRERRRRRRRGQAPGRAARRRRPPSPRSTGSASRASSACALRADSSPLVRIERRRTLRRRRWSARPCPSLPLRLPLPLPRPRTAGTPYLSRSRPCRRHPGRSRRRRSRALRASDRRPTLRLPPRPRRTSWVPATPLRPPLRHPPPPSCNPRSCFSISPASPSWRGTASAPLTLLRDYDARFPDGALRSEATMLRIEALIATGRRDEAARLGRSVIDRDPDGPYVARIRSLLGETNP